MLTYLWQIFTYTKFGRFAGWTNKCAIQSGPAAVFLQGQLKEQSLFLKPNGALSESERTLRHPYARTHRLFNVSWDLLRYAIIIVVNEEFSLHKGSWQSRKQCDKCAIFWLLVAMVQVPWEVVAQRSSTSSPRRRPQNGPSCLKGKKEKDRVWWLVIGFSTAQRQMMTTCSQEQDFAALSEEASSRLWDLDSFSFWCYFAKTVRIVPMALRRLLLIASTRCLYCTKSVSESLVIGVFP